MWFLLGSLVIGASGATSAGCARTPPEARRAQVLIDRGDYAGARTAAETALAKHPDSAVLWRLHIRAALGMGDAAAAVSLYFDWRNRPGRAGRHDREALKQMALTTLWQGLRVPSAEVGARAIQAIERVEAEPLADDVSARMTDEEDMVAAAAAVALLRSDPSAPDIATQLLRSDVAEARAVVVEGLGRKLKDSELRRLVRRDLVPMLADPSPDVRAAAVIAVGRIEDKADIERLKAMAVGDADNTVRAMAIAALADRGQVPGAEALMRRALADSAAEVRAAATRHAAMLLGKEGAAKVASEMARDPHALVRVAAAHALARLGERGRAESMLTEALAAPESAVRLEAAKALTELGAGQGSAALIALLGDADPSVRDEALRAHRQLTDALVRALADDAATVRVAAAEMVLTLLD